MRVKDVAKAEELESTISSLLNQEALVLKEEADLERDVLLIAKAEFDAENQLRKDQDDLATLGIFR